jgi:Apea-like HEPN
MAGGYIWRSDPTARACGATVIASAGKRTCSRSTHALRKRKTGCIAVPCRVTDDPEPKEFEIAGIRFLRTSEFISEIQSAGELHAPGLDEPVTQASLQQTPWIALAQYVAMDPKLGGDRALVAVQAALELLAALLDPRRGDRLVTDLVPSRAKTSIYFSLDADDKWSLSWTHHSLQTAFGEGWYEYLRGDLGWFLEMGGQAVAGLLKPRQQFPLEQRFLDALHWFGLACRESSSANRIAACAFALERLCMTREVDELRKIGTAFAQRTIALAREFIGYNAHGWFAQLVDLYEVRSALAHGDMSPDDSRIEPNADFALAVTRSALLGSLAVYAGVFSGRGTEADLQAHFNLIAPLGSDKQ